jgi:hypothetical protein
MRGDKHPSFVSPVQSEKIGPTGWDRGQVRTVVPIRRVEDEPGPATLSYRGRCPAEAKGGQGEACTGILWAMVVGPDSPL